MRAADLVIEGRIATLRGRAGFGWVEALAIGDGRVVAAGRAAEVEALADSATSRWRLGQDLVVTPALTDAHLHLFDAALAAGQPELTGLRLAEVARVVAARHRQRHDSADSRSWLLGHGWSFAALGERPMAALLDAAAPGRPVALWSHDHHSRWLNSEAISLAGIADRDDPPSGRIERDGDGRPTGILYEHAAGLVDAAIPEPAAHEVEVAVEAYAGDLAGLGVTSVHDPGGLAPDEMLRGGLLRFRAMARDGRLPLRVTVSIREEQLDRAIETGFRSGRPETDPANPAEPANHAKPAEPALGRYRDGWLKLFSDGALGSRTAALLAPYEPDDPSGPPPGGPTGMQLRTCEELARLATKAARAGIASQIHAIGDAAVRTVLDAFEKVPAVAGVMHRVEHAQLVDESDAARFRTLGVAASVQPCHLLSDADAVRTAWGRRSARAFPLADLDAEGAVLAIGTDAPVEPADPWPGIAAAVTRRGPGWPAGRSLHPEQAISLARALRGACLDGPRSAGRVDEGYLDVGARADLLVLPAHSFSVLDAGASAERLADIRPLATLLDGIVVYRAPDFDP